MFTISQFFQVQNRPVNVPFHETSKLLGLLIRFRRFVFIQVMSDDSLKIYEGTSAAGNLLATLTGHEIPGNVSSCRSEMHVVFASSFSESSTGYHAKIHTSELASPGQAGYCTSKCLCIADEGHCESNDQCISGHNCGFDNCKPELGYPNGTNCCYNIADYCSDFLSTENGTWMLQSPINNSNEYVSEVSCSWYIGGSGSATCGATVADWSCCSSANPCIVEDGDCDSDSECESGLTCGTNNCGPLFPYSFDCCESPNLVLNLALQSYEVSFYTFHLLLKVNERN